MKAQSITEVRQAICSSVAANDRAIIDAVAARVASSDSFKSAVACLIMAADPRTDPARKALSESLAAVTLQVIVQNAVAAEALRMARDGGRLQ